jgi:dicarboxylate transporter 10
LFTVTYGSARFAIYESAKEAATKDNSTLGLSISIPAGVASGFFGSIVGNPADVANIRIQHDAMLHISAARHYRSVFDALAKIGQEEGLKGNTRGLWPNCIRGASMTTCQLASYDALKPLLVNKFDVKDDAATQLLASIFASLVATTWCSPFDIIKTRVMSSSRNRRLWRSCTMFLGGKDIDGSFADGYPAFFDWVLTRLHV